MGTPLTIYIEKDVDDREDLVELITVCESYFHTDHAVPSLPSQKHGGAVSPSYSGTPYILGKCPSISLNRTNNSHPHIS